MISVVTSVFNRLECMRRLYYCLCNQSCNDFEWIIIDDGSRDGLSELVKLWGEETSGFSIKYHYRPNGGKHRAINYAIQFVSSEYIFVVDSDDYLSCDAIRFISNHTIEIDDDIYGGMCFPYYSYINKKRNGSFPKGLKYIDCGQLERFKLGLTGDVCSCFKKDVLEKYRFPEYEGENFLSEGTSWFMMELDGFIFRIYDEPLYYNEYLKDGLTRNQGKIFYDNPQGWAAYIRTISRFTYADSRRHKIQYIGMFGAVCSDEKICHLLGISQKEFIELDNEYLGFMNKLKMELKNNSIRIALYGGGMNSWFFRQYLEKLGKNVEYIIDREEDKIAFYPVYSTRDVLPPVDIVFITTRKIDEAEVDVMTSKMGKGTIIRRLDSLSSSMW